MRPGASTSVAHRQAWVLTTVLVAAVLVLSLLVVIGKGSWLPGVAECTVEQGERSVGLSAEEAENAATLAARAVRLRLPSRLTERALAKVLDATEEDVSAVAAALTGRAAGALSCLHGGADDTESNRLDQSGLTGRAGRVRREVRTAFGPQKEGGFAPGGVTDGHMRGSAHYEGRAVDLFLRPVTRRNQRSGWAMAQYLVAHAGRLEIETVIFDGRIWTARRAHQGWRAYAPDTTNRSARVAAILEHRDHVHVDVAD